MKHSQARHKHKAVLCFD
uniref:Uncharacterized protein n=1 Tax=Anguilla anguilla TaxID=7936 RepID=A0A0E9Q5B0_ANGAN